MSGLERVKRATTRRARAEQEWRDAITAACEAGVSLRVIGDAAGVSHVRVLQIKRAHATSPHARPVVGHGL